MFIWMTNEDQNNPEEKQRVKEIIKEYSAKKYRCVVFESGSRSLLESTTDLLVHNKKACAPKEDVGEKALQTSNAKSR